MSRLPELSAKIDAFFERVAARYGSAMQCHTGCADCCHVRLTITRVEAQAIVDEIARWDDDRRRALAAQVAAARPDRCVALDEHDRCAIYAARPVVCRSHGVPIRIRERSLPVVQSCHRNFAAGFDAIAADCVLDQTTLSAMTLAVDRHFASLRDAAPPGEAGVCSRDAGGDGTRVDLAALLSDVGGRC